MGIIKVNGNLYGGTNASASAISYSNAASGLSSTTVQNAIDTAISTFDVFQGSISNDWINDSNVYSEIEKMISSYGANSTFTLCFGENNTNTPANWTEWALTYKNGSIVAWTSDESCTNFRYGANNYAGWKRPLCAGDGLKFQFTINDIGEYGYLNKEGEFVPFRPGDRSDEFRLETIASLKFSGMGLTADSTWDDILAALQAYFPRIYNIISKASSHFGTWSGSGTTTLGSTMVISTKTRSGTYGNSIYATSKGIDLTKYDTLIMKGTNKGTVNGGDAANNLVITIVGNEGTFTIYNRQDWIYNTTKNYTMNVSYDISKLTGLYTVKFDFYYYISEDSASCTVTEFRLEGHYGLD